MTEEKARDRKNNLKLTMQYDKLTATIEGEYDEVWKAVNTFLGKVRQTVGTQRKSVSTSGKTVGEIVLELRNAGFFDKRRPAKEVYSELRKLGKTDVTSNAVAMALKELTSDGELARLESEKGYEYLAPWGAGDRKDG